MDTLDNLAKYKIFLSVAECKSISKAAAQLYISQPAVSITIRKLEESLNTVYPEIKRRFAYGKRKIII